MDTRRIPLLPVLLAMLALWAPAIAAGAREAGWSAETGADPVPTIKDLSVSGEAFSPSGTARMRRVELRFHSTIDQQLRIGVLDAAGRDVRTIVDTRVGVGLLSYAWNGTRADGTPVPDGSYELVVEAGTTSDTMSISDIVRVDRRAPTIATPVRRIRLSSRTARSFELPISASEASLLQASTSGAAGRARVASNRPPGRSTLAVPIRSGAMLRRALDRNGRARVTVRIVATDSAGNRTARSVRVDLLPPRATDPAPPTSTTPITGSSRLSWPLVGPITSRYGPRWGRMHNGIDVGVPTGRPIQSAAPGRVTYAGWMSGYGNTVTVDHGTLTTLYAHQSRIAVRSGQSVARGQVVGYVGSTGNSTGPHLHFEVRVGGAARDPLHYLP